MAHVKNPSTWVVGAEDVGSRPLWATQSHLVSNTKKDREEEKGRLANTMVLHIKIKDTDFVSW